MDNYSPSFFKTVKMYIAFYIFGVIFTSILLGIAGTRTFYLYNFLKTAESSTGTVVSYQTIKNSKGSNTYAPQISFNTKVGERIFFTSSTSSSSYIYPINERISMLYNPQNPMEAEIDTFWELWAAQIITGGTALLLITIMLVTLLKIYRDIENKKWVQKNGKPIETEYVGIAEGNIRINRRSSLIIQSQWLNPENNTIYTFSSENLWFDPTNYIDKKNKIKVYIDPQNPKKYFMDISFLPKQA